MQHKRYPSDLTDEQWALLGPWIPPARPGGRPRKTDMLEVVNAIFYLTREGCTWRALPHDFPAWKTVYNYFQWFNADGRWSYEPVKSSKRLASGTIDIGADAPAKFMSRVGWGSHRLDIKTLDGEETSVAFDVGWSGTASADTPDNVVVTLDKANYAPGEEAKLRIASAFAVKATIGNRRRRPFWRIFSMV